MTTKKFISTILLIAILATQFSFLSFVMPVVVNAKEDTQTKTTENIAKKYFYNQLDDDAKVFYEIFDEMFYRCDYDALKAELSKGDSDFGVNSLDITSKISNNENLRNKLDSYTKGGQDLLNTMGAARDAYFADHAGLFYVDADHVSLRVLSQGGRLKVFLGIGRSETYINKAFWDYENKKVKTQELIKALDDVKAALASDVEQVKAVVISENQDIVEQQIKKAHELVIKANSYKLEETIIEENKSIQNENEKGDPWNVRTVYGAFGPKHEIVCEGFARAFKMILDEMDIPCVLVYGAYVTSVKYEEHMWNYVQLGNKWYGVDPTWDNTDKKDIDKEFVGQEAPEKVSTEYFLAGNDKMALNHRVTGIMSVSNFEFKYPPIEDSSDKYEIAYENAGLRVEIDDESYDEEDGIAAGKFKISYFIDLNENGVEDPGERMGYQKAKEHGYYLICSTMQYNKPDYDFSQDPVNGLKEESWTQNSYFSYTDPKIYGSLRDFYEDNGEEVGENDGKEGRDSYLSFYNANCYYLQFGVTQDAPVDARDASTVEDIARMTTYFGTTEDMLAVSNLLLNPNGSHVKAPYIKTASPIQNSTMYIGEKYHCEIVYDEKLVQIPGETLEPKVTIEKSSNAGDNRYSLTEFHFDNDRTITFDFTPSDLYADDSVFYIIDMMGLMGENSQKRPMPASYFCAHKCAAYAYKSQGIDWNVYGKPTLMDDVNLDDMTDEENSDLADLLKHRMTLVTTTTKPSEEKAMNDMLTDEMTDGGKVVKSETYNIKLTLCKMQKIRDGQSVRIMLGFPDGYGPEDAGVTFKAYHYIKDNTGKIIDVEEIPCLVTELGLVIECSSFSPFTVAAVENAKKEDTSKTVIFQTSQGGEVYTDDAKTQKANKIVFNDETREAKITIKPDEGYVVDDIVIGEQIIDVNGDDTLSLSANENNEVTYTIKYDDLKKQNYEAMVAKVAFIPEVTKEAEKEQGMEIVSQPLAQSSVEIVSSTDKEKYDEGETVEVTYKVNNFNSLEDNTISGLGALLTYNKEALHLVDIEAGSNWTFSNSITDVTEGHNLIGTYSLENDSLQYVESQVGSVIFKAKFIVIENENVIEQIKLSHIDIGTGKGSVKASDVITNVVIEQIPDIIEEKLENQGEGHYTITDDLVKGVEIGETVATMKAKVTSGTTLPVVFFKHSAEAPETLIELGDNEKIFTGTVIKVGSREWRVVVRSDLDGNGELTANDIALFKLDYIGEEKLQDIYLLAADTDGVTATDFPTSANDLVIMILQYNEIALDD